MPKIQKGFQTPREVTDYFRQKRSRPAFSWGDVWGEEHAYAFTVAKAVDAELLGAFRSSLDGAIAGGESFETWKAKIAEDLKRLGWWGPRAIPDPTGADPDATVDFSRSRRLKTIFWSNMRAARAAGQWDRIQRTKRALPYLLYVRSSASDPREEHLAWAGMVLPVDDPFWSTHFPPNGWGCKCAVRQITLREANRLVSSGEMEFDGARIPVTDKAPPIEVQAFTNRRTGIITQVPNGIDPGWQTNPGLSRARTLAARLHEELEDAGPEIARGKISELFDSSTPRVLAGLKERVQLPIAVSEPLQKILAARSPLVVVSSDTMAVKTGKHAPISVDTFALVQDMIEAGHLIDEGRDRLQRAVYAQLGAAWWKLVIKRSAAGYLRLHTLYRVDAKRALKWLGNPGSE
ncbi:MAG: phage minor head protein [Roseibium sp.]|uniref:phage head morphogenesis protein n=1 Tax=Roseibium polysiphoniae TaxID=2571221 RepID=UPI003298CB18